jgi:peptide-methionine (S)-S-oxide reductase
MIKIKYYFCLLTIIAFMGCLPQEEALLKVNSKKSEEIAKNKTSMEISIIGGGCFWCTEAVFERIEGIKDVVSGYAGGEVLNPTYKQICTGTTGHAEVIKITSDPSIISFSKILNLFGECHDPTTLNRQGADVGTQYRSTIMYLSDEQKNIATEWKNRLSQKLEDPVVTEIVPAPIFYPAEDYHQDYYKKNPNQGYCSFVIRPKLKKLNLE